jgi:hypothetical protein
MPYTHVLAADLNWSDANHRVAVALCHPAGRIVVGSSGCTDQAIYNTLSGLDDDASVLVLLDVPIEGIDRLQSARTRPVDRALAGSGIATLPATGAGSRGPRLRSAILAESAGKPTYVDVREMYPFAIYRVLAYLHDRDRLGALAAGDLRPVLGADFTTYRHPRYKRRERDAGRRWEAIRFLYGLLTHPVLGLTWEGLPAPERARGRAEDELVDLYEAALGGVLGALVLRGSPYAMHIGDAVCGEMILLADAWMSARLATRLPVAPLVVVPSWK